MSSPVAATLAAAASTSVDRPRAAGLDALPIVLDVGPLSDRVRRFVEGELGWQVVAPGDADLPSRVAIVGTDGSRVPSVAHLLLVGGDERPGAVAEACVRLRPEATLTWPDEREQLAAVIARIVDRRDHGEPGDSATALTVGGSAGGVGTTTITVALAAARSWLGRQSLAVVAPPVALDLPVHPREVLASSRLWSAAVAVPGAAEARALCCVRGFDAPVLDLPATGTVIVDRGVESDVDVLVVRPDRAGVEALSATVASVVIVNGPGPVPLGRCRQAAAGRRIIELPWSVRVARADLRGRGPAAYPGSWVRSLLPLVRGPTG